MRIDVLEALTVTTKEIKDWVKNRFSDELKSNYDKAYSHSQSAHAPSDAEKNVQPDWNVTSTSSDAYIKNKPGIASEDKLGLIKIGAGLQVDSSTGVVTVTGESVVNVIEWENILSKPTTISGYGITDAKIDVDENGVLYFG